MFRVTRGVPVALLCLVGCASTGVVEGPVRLGQVAAVDGPRVRADRVVEDSRCPVDTRCVWAGRLIVRATVMGGGWPRRMDLTLGTPVTIADGSLVLARVTPERRSAGRMPPYRFTFAFKGGR